MTVYVVRAKGTDLYKVGYTSGSAKERIASMQTGCPYDLEVVCELDGGRKAEQALHAVLTDFRSSGEWFDASESGLFPRVVRSGPSEWLRKKSATARMAHKMEFAKERSGGIPKKGEPWWPDADIHALERAMWRITDDLEVAAAICEDVFGHSAVDNPSIVIMVYDRLQEQTKEERAKLMELHGYCPACEYYRPHCECEKEK